MKKSPIQQVLTDKDPVVGEDLVSRCDQVTMGHEDEVLCKIKLLVGGKILDIESVYLEFLNILEQASYLFIPRVSHTSLNCKKFPAHIVKLISYRNLLVNDSPSPRLKFKLAKNSYDLQKAISKFKKNREKQFVAKKGNNLYKWMAYRLNKKSSVFPPLVAEDKSYFSDKEKAAFFMSYFSKYWDNEQKVKLPSILNVDCKFDFNLPFIQDSDVYNLLNSVKAKSNFSADNISNWVLKQCTVSLSTPVGYILRKSFLFADIPSYWKSSLIKPIHKKACKSVVSNYRPISINCSLAKIAEQCVLKEISSFIYNTQSKLFENMHGFLPNKSVISCLLEIYDEFTRAIDEKKCIDLFIFDITKAFDTINHDLLIRKLNNLGITGNCLAWIKSFLNNRLASVQINNQLSDRCTIKQGLPQGSPLSPFLFNCFILDFLKNSSNSVIVKAYADDIKAFIIFDKHNQNVRKSDMDSFINGFNEWLNLNGLEISPAKCKVLHLGNNNPCLNYSMNSSKLICSDDPFKILGLTFSPNLLWKTHINEKCLVAIRLWFNVMRVIRSTDHNILIRIYKSYVRPHVEFASEIFNDYSKSTTDLIETVQRKVTRYIFYRSKYLCKNFNHQCPEYSKRLDILNLEPLSIRRFKAELLTFFKITKKLLVINKRNLPSSQTAYRTRNNCPLTLVSHSRTNLRLNSFFIRVPRKFFKLPKQCTNASSLSDFIHHLNNVNLAQLLS